MAPTRCTEHMANREADCCYLGNLAKIYRTRHSAGRLPLKLQMYILPL